MEESYVLAIDVAKGKSMVALVSFYGEALIEPYEINHTLNDFKQLNERIKKLNILNKVSVFMEYTGVYQMPVKRFFLENNYNVFIINPLLGKMYKNNLRKTKTDKEDCLKLAELFFVKEFKQHFEPSQLYLNLNAMSREYNHLMESTIRLKNQFKDLVYLTFPEYESIFKGHSAYLETSLEFIKKFPHADIIKHTRVDAIANAMFKVQYRHANYYLKRAKKIKDYAISSFPSISKNDEMINSLITNIEMLEIHINKLEKLKTRMIENAFESYMFKPLVSIEGIGEFSAALIIAELGDISRFDNIKQLTAYCGLDPSIKQSGKSININGNISKTGNRHARRILFNCVMNIIRISSKSKSNNAILVYYRKKRNEGKHHYVAVIACCTKLLRQIFALCKKDNM